MKKKIDSRIRTLIENAIKLRQRGFFLIVGDRGRDQVVNLYHLLTKLSHKGNRSVLWCYKKELGFSSHRKKRMKQIKKMQAKGQYDPDVDDPFELFASSTDIQYCFYKDSHRILGSTHTMLVLQDFESITPNLLCRTVETVEGGGIVVMLLRTMTSLKQLYSLTMDVHSKFRTEAYGDVEPRFNERFILSLGSCKNCIVMDDELNILPISSHTREIKPIDNPQTEDGDAYVIPEEKELKDLKKSLASVEPVGRLVDLTRTVDQAKAIMTFVDSIADKTLRTTVTLTAARGRGKSAALGIAIAGAVVYGPDNLKSLFEFVFKGFDALNYKEHTDYEILQSTNPEFKGSIVRVNIYKNHRQTIQYIRPNDHAKLSQAELVVIDEAAAIPIPLVKGLLGPYLVFMSSTVNGYEGTGRSLSLKLIDQLRKNSNNNAAFNSGEEVSMSVSAGGRALKELTLTDPIRYGKNDPIEKWLYDLLCLEATKVKNLHSGFVDPNVCELYWVNRDTLFSYHKSSEKFLHQMMALYVSSHYKNTPNDLQLLSDAPAHDLFVLLGPLQQDYKDLPDVLCVIQVCYEGEINKKSVMESIKRGYRPSGDLIPWTMSEQFQDNDFPSLNGVRIVRIACHPDAQRMGYGSRALELLTRYFQGDLVNLSEEDATKDHVKINRASESSKVALDSEELKPRKKMSPLLQKLSEKKPVPIHYMGTSFGMTRELYNFWKKNGYNPCYIRQTPNDLTGEHTCIMLKALETSDVSLPQAFDNKEKWLQPYVVDFRRRFSSLLSFEFSKLGSSGALSIINASNDNQFRPMEQSNAMNKDELDVLFTRFDLKRLEAYSRNLVDYHMILDMIPSIAKLFFTGKLGDTNLAPSQAVILLGIGLQNKSVDDLQTELKLPSSQILAFFNKIVRKVNNKFRALCEAEIEKSLPSNKQAQSAKAALKPVNEDIDAELSKSGKKAVEKLNQSMTKAKKSNSKLARFEIGEEERDELDKALADKDGDVPKSISVKSKKRPLDEEEFDHDSGKKKQKKSKKNKKQKM
eukprot:CAMPEP_0115041186 /NCGR_PEP_ID=MMETSP0216-20121206/45354_1 /TAXON_ID=223996 /ORGANISM="Protocruzia adherens, Strain Boccale" /LENGTH=1031 /DNA_ID=CAMNT_0002422729 /DNA_START=28 /DNA_END=3123 /DNA_ORIENTATION=-